MRKERADWTRKCFFRFVDLRKRTVEKVVVCRRIDYALDVCCIKIFLYRVVGAERERIVD